MAFLKFSLLVFLSLESTTALVPNLSKGATFQPKPTTTSTAQKAIAIPLPNSDTSESFGSLAKEDEWVANLDYEGFGKEVAELGKRLQKEGGQDDVDHLNKIVSWRDAAAWIGLATMWMNPNPLTVLALSTWTYAS